MMMSAINKFLLSIASPKALKSVGFKLLIAGLIAEAIVIVAIPSGTLEKALTALCTIAIAIGVWFEEVGGDEIAAPRRLTPEQQRRIASKMSPFKGLRAVLGAIPPSAKNTDLLDQILQALKAAEVDAFINLSGVEASVSPTGRSNRGTMLTEGFPTGINMLFVSGNERGEAFANALAKALNDENLTASAVGDRDERTMEWRLQQGAANGLTRNDKQFEPVMVVVGDKS
jgi:hypothetical protein